MHLQSPAPKVTQNHKQVQLHFFHMPTVTKDLLGTSCRCQRNRKGVQRENKCKYLNQNKLHYLMQRIAPFADTGIQLKKSPWRKRKTNCSPVFQSLERSPEAGPRHGSISKRWCFNSVYHRKKKPKQTIMQQTLRSSARNRILDGNRALSSSVSVKIKMRKNTSNLMATCKVGCSRTWSKNLELTQKLNL